MNQRSYTLLCVVSLFVLFVVYTVCGNRSEERNICQSAEHFVRDDKTYITILSDRYCPSSVLLWCCCAAGLVVMIQLHIGLELLNKPLLIMCTYI